MLNFIRTPQNIIGNFLASLNVQYTNLHLNELAKSRSSRLSLLDITDVLNDYNIANLSVKVPVENLVGMETPFIAQQQLPEDRFVIVKQINNNKVTYQIENGEIIRSGSAEFIEVCSGVILLAEKEANSQEPFYKENKRLSALNKTRNPFLVTSIAAVFIYLYVKNAHLIHSYEALLGVTYLLGLIITTILVKQGTGQRNALFNMVCSVTNKNDCNDVLEGPASKLFGLISWSDIGFSYFLGNLLTVLLFPNFVHVLFYINILALPYTFWSVHYQWIVAKQWCVFCLMIQGLLWLSFFVHVPYLSMTSTTQIGFSVYFGVLLCFLFPFAMLMSVTPLLKLEPELNMIRLNANAMRFNELVFKALLYSRENVDIDGEKSEIFFGNANAGLIITLVTNPYCGPCAEMHQRLQKMLDAYGTSMRLQIIFAPGGSKETMRHIAIKNLVAKYIQFGPKESEHLYLDWFINGKFNAEKFFLDHPVELNDEKIDDIFNAHEQWCESVDIRFTPTIYVNGYLLPSSYQIEDLKYFLHCFN